MSVAQNIGKVLISGEQKHADPLSIHFSHVSMEWENATDCQHTHNRLGNFGVGGKVVIGANQRSHMILDDNVDCIAQCKGRVFSRIQSPDSQPWA